MNILEEHYGETLSEKDEDYRIDIPYSQYKRMLRLEKGLQSEKIINSIAIVISLFSVAAGISVASQPPKIVYKDRIVKQEVVKEVPVEKAVTKNVYISDKPIDSSEVEIAYYYLSQQRSYWKDGGLSLEGMNEIIDKYMKLSPQARIKAQHILDDTSELSYNGKFN